MHKDHYGVVTSIELKWTLLVCIQYQIKNIMNVNMSQILQVILLQFKCMQKTLQLHNNVSTHASQQI